MKLIVLIFIGIFLPGLLPLVLFYWGIAFSIERLSIAPGGAWEAITYRIIPAGVILVAGIFFFAAIASGDGTSILILLILALIAAYRGGIFTKFTREHFSLGFNNNPLPNYSPENKNTVAIGRDYELFIKGVIIEQGWNVVMTALS